MITDNKRFLTHYDCFVAAQRLLEFAWPKGKDKVVAYAVPRGGIPVGYLLGAVNNKVNLLEHPVEAGFDWIVDDIVDSGATRARFKQSHPTIPFLALTDYLAVPRQPGQWIVFPWEVTEKGTDESATDIITRLLQFIGEDPAREGLRETPQRVLKAWKEWTSGYATHEVTGVQAILKTFGDGAQKYDEMLIQPRLPFYSHCEHHLAPFFGTVTIGYIPNGRVVGLSKFKRLVDVFAKRLQVQERMTEQIANALHAMDPQPKGVGVQVRARHLCMESRGVECQGQETVTNCFYGAMFANPTARAEFLQACK